MLHPDKIFGRLGNRMFQLAFCYAYAKDKGIDHYFQDPKFFEKYQDEIRTLYQINPETIDKVAIHIRRGDYVNNPFYVDLTQTDYYVKAMAEFPNEKFIIFSDDLEWCSKQEIFKECELSTNLSDIDDLEMMARCKGIIMANSSFSWWGAFLSKGKVIAPKEYYTDLEERTKLLKTWKRI